MHRRSEEPSVTSIQCYWKGSVLSKADIVDDDIGTILGKPTTLNNDEDDLNFVESVVADIDTKKAVIFQFFDKSNTNAGSIHDIWTRFLEENPNNVECEHFLQYAENSVTESIVRTVEQCTRHQAECNSWFEMRFGRITASNVYEAAQSRTLSGSLQEKILGAAVPLESEAVNRGKRLESKVLKVVAKEKKIQIIKGGLFLRKDYPIFGASPDGLSTEYVIEVKCPSKQKRIDAYIKDGIIARKFYFQIQMQMMFVGKKHGLFCVASPDFEIDGKVEIVEVAFKESEMLEVLDRAKSFWRSSIFDQLLRSYV